MKRRTFLSGTCASAITSVFAGCGGQADNKTAGQSTAVSKPGLKEIAHNMNMQELKTLIRLLATRHMYETGNCAQATFMALQDVFEFGGTVDLRALTALPGVAERGETCGTITAALMAMGIVYGGTDRSAYEACMQESNLFIERFRQRIAHTHCKEILREALGKDLDLRNPEDLNTYRTADGPAFCSTVAAKAVEIAVEIILKK